MKAELKINEPKFPALYRENPNGKVVLFTSPNTGTCVLDPQDKDLGKYLPDNSAHTAYWAECTNELIWERLPAGSVLNLIQE